MPSLRFVEINGDKQNVEILENLPSQIVGHQGEIKPQITNGHISRHHCTVCYSVENGQEKWLVIDGDMIKGASSTNGLKDKFGEKILGKATLENVGDRVYLLYLYNTNAYLEVFATEVEKVNSTQGLDPDLIQPELNRLRVNTALMKDDLSTAISLANNNKTHLDKVDKAHTEITGKIDSLFNIVERGLNQVEEVGNKPKPFIIGFSIFLVVSLLSIGVYEIYLNKKFILRQMFNLEIVEIDKHK